MSKNNNIYLVASYSARPKDPRMTSQKGYMSNSDNIEYDEQVYVARGMSQKHLKNRVFRVIFSVIFYLSEKPNILQKCMKVQKKHVKNVFLPRKTRFFRHISVKRGKN